MPLLPPPVDTSPTLPAIDSTFAVLRGAQRGLVDAALGGVDRDLRGGHVRLGLRDLLGRLRVQVGLRPASCAAVTLLLADVTCACAVSIAFWSFSRVVFWFCFAVVMAC